MKTSMTERRDASKSKPRQKTVSRKFAIRETAVELFSKHGYDQTSLKDIADAVGVTHPALYYYYRSKSDILFDAVASSLSTLLHQLHDARDACDASSPQDRLRALCVRQIMFQLDGLDVTPLADSVLFGPLSRVAALSQDQQSTLKQQQRGLIDLFRHEIKKISDMGKPVVSDTSAAALTIIGTISNVTYWYRESGKLSKSELAEVVADFCLAGLAGFKK